MARLAGGPACRAFATGSTVMIPALRVCGALCAAPCSAVGSDSATPPSEAEEGCERIVTFSGEIDCVSVDVFRSSYTSSHCEGGVALTLATALQGALHSKSRLHWQTVCFVRKMLNHSAMRAITFNRFAISLGVCAILCRLLLVSLSGCGVFLAGRKIIFAVFTIFLAMFCGMREIGSVFCGLCSAFIS